MESIPEKTSQAFRCRNRKNTNTAHFQRKTIDVYRMITQDWSNLIQVR